MLDIQSMTDASDSIVSDFVPEELPYEEQLKTEATEQASFR